MHGNSNIKTAISVADLQKSVGLSYKILPYLQTTAVAQFCIVLKMVYDI